MKAVVNIIRAHFVACVLIYLATLPSALAVTPPPDGGYPNGNTAEGTFSLLSLTTGSGNTGLGWRALQSDTTGSYNSATGYGALFSNNASLNTANGFDALFSNSTGTANTATGARALYHNITGAYNTADGAGALFSNTGPTLGCDSCGSRNTAVGAVALFSNQSGYSNTAVGTDALFQNTSGANNTAVGDNALLSNSASNNTAVGSGALLNINGDGNTAIGADTGPAGAGAYNTVVGAGALSSIVEIGSENTAIGYQAGANTLAPPGNDNILVGAYAGQQVFYGNWNIDIGNVGGGGNGESNTIRLGTQFDPGSGSGQNRVFIAGVAGTTLDSGVPVVVDTSTGQLGVLPSSQRFKADIRPMDKASEAILALRPVMFCFENSSTGAPQFGLIAEEVAKVNQDLVVRDSLGKPYAVRYDAVNAMLLNEFLKEHKKVEEQQVTIAELKSTVVKQQKRFTEQEAEIQALTSNLQKVCMQIEKRRPASRMSRNAAN
jgi:uncharacterized coiled-coil protein SlyX